MTEVNVAAVTAGSAAVLSRLNAAVVSECLTLSTGLPKQDSGHWWSTFFFGKQPGMTPLTEEAQHKYGHTRT